MRGAASMLLAAVLLLFAAGFVAQHERRLLANRIGGAAAGSVPSPGPALASLSRVGVGAALVTLGGLVGLALGGATGSLAGIVVGAVANAWRTRRRAVARRAVLDEQLADAALAVGAGLRAGQSLPQALAYAADEVDPPLDEALARVVDAVELGTPLDEALARFGVEVGTDDARLAVGALRLHRRSGGDLPMVLDQVAGALRERRSVAREVRALTAQARLSGAILGLLPIGFFAFLWLTSRRDIAAAYQTRAGAAAIALGLVLEGAAFLWIRRLLEVR